MNSLLENLICLAKKALKLITEQVATATEKPSTPVTPAHVAEVKAPVETPVVEETAPVLEEAAVVETSPIIEETAPVETAVVAEPAPVIAEVSVPVTAKATTDNLPEDSILRRHALAHLKNILEAVKGARPSDSIQSRHYDAEINSQISQAIVCKTAFANATANYENLTKTTVESSIEEVSVTTAETEAVESVEIAVDTNAPTDSILRRHYEALKNS